MTAIAAPVTVRVTWMVAAMATMVPAPTTGVLGALRFLAGTFRLLLAVAGRGAAAGGARVASVAGGSGGAVARVRVAGVAAAFLAAHRGIRRRWRAVSHPGGTPCGRLLAILAALALPAIPLVRMRLPALTLDGWLTFVLCLASLHLGHFLHVVLSHCEKVCVFDWAFPTFFRICRAGATLLTRRVLLPNELCWCGIK